MARAELLPYIATYKESPSKVVAALDGITEDELDFRPAPDEWTVHEIVQHLADSEMLMNTRLRFILAQSNPLLVGFDPDVWTPALSKPGRPIAKNLALFIAIRAATADLLDDMADDDWDRGGVNTDRGTQTFEGILKYIADHGHDHANQIRNNRAAAAAAVSGAAVAD